MAIIGRYPEILKYLAHSEKVEIVKTYLDDALEKGSPTHHRLHQLPMNTFERFDIQDSYYAVEQKFLSKDREQCFFESHIKHIDIQVMVEGEETIEIVDTSHMTLKENLVDTRDLLIYHDYRETHKILLRAGDVAIFFPNDAHMGTQVYKTPTTCVKTVVKMPVSFFRL